MYLNTTVKIPVVKGKIITKRKGENVYVLYQYCRFRISQCAISANLGVHIPVVMMCSFR